MNYNKPGEFLTLKGRLVFMYRVVGTRALHLQKPGLGEILKVNKYENLIVTVGKEAVVRALTGDLSKANPGQITFGSVGTGTNGPAIGDVKLQAEFFRKILSVRTPSSNVASWIQARTMTLPPCTFARETFSGTFDTRPMVGAFVSLGPTFR